MADKGRPQTFDVFVGGLPTGTDRNGIEPLFKKYGDIASIYINESSKGVYGFVRYVNEEDANAVCAEYSVEYNGVVLQVNRGNRDRPKRDNQFGASRSGPGGDTKRPGGKFRNNAIDQNKPDLVSNHQPPNVRTGPRQSSMESLQDTPTEDVMCTHIEGPCVFWGQPVNESQKQAMAELYENLSMLCETAIPICAPPQLNKTYAAKFTEDNAWYRCRINMLKDDSTSEVIYIDYGNSEVVQNSDIREIPPRLANVKPHAKKYILYGLKSIYEKGLAGYEEGRKLLQSLIDGHLVKVTPHGMTAFTIGKSFTPVLVDINGVDVNQRILEGGFAERRVPDRVLASRGLPTRSREGHSENMTSNGRQPPTTGFPDKQQGSGFGGRPSFKIKQEDDWGNETNINPAQSIFDPPGGGHITNEAPTIDMWDAGAAASSTQTNTSTSFQNMIPPQSLITSLSHAMSQPTSMPPTHIPPPTQANSVQVQEELQSAHYEIQRLRNELLAYQIQSNDMQDERNAALLEHAKMRGEMRKLEQEFNKMQHCVLEMGLNHKIKQLLVNVHEVKRLRLQFPTERETRDNIEWAIDLVRNGGQKICLRNLDMISNVEQTMNVYNRAQDAIKMCKEESELPMLISARDQARLELQKSLLEFNEIVSKLPLDARKQSFYGVLDGLKSTHGVFMSLESTDKLQLSDALEIYSSWKAKKTTEFRQRRAFTNACHNSLNGSLVLLQQELALDVSSTAESSVIIADLDNPLKKYTDAVQNEIMATNVERGDEAGFITIILKTLMHEIKTELADIEHLVKLQKDYSSLLTQITRWLHETPNVSDLHKIRKNMKSIKSKLRHKLADKQDMEDSDESCPEELKQVETDLNKLRAELHGIFQQEDHLLAHLADLSENHFPELAVQYPDAGIDNEAEYGGLVKLGRSLEYFTTSPLEGCDKASVMKCMYNAETVILKEFIVDDSLGIRKGDFLRRAMAYHHVTHPNVLRLSAIFFVKGKRNAYLQLPYYASNAQNIVARGKLSPTALHDILSGVLNGLKCLHDAKLVHGAVHPNNVCINSDGKGVLAEFDFTKSLQQRTEHEYIAPNGLKFVSPEVASSGQISRAADIYNFGLLALWLLRPYAHVSLNQNGTPDLADTDLGHTGLSALIRCVLTENPSTRPSSTELLTAEYFVTSPRSLSESPKEEQTLQLRPKHPSPPIGEKMYSGILKNASPSTTPPPLDSLPQVSHPVSLPPIPPVNIDTLPQIDTDANHYLPNIPTTPDLEVANILTNEAISPTPDVVSVSVAEPADNESDGAPPLEPIDTDDYDESGDDKDEELIQFIKDTISEDSMKSNEMSGDIGHGGCSLGFELAVPEISVQGPTPTASPVPPELTETSQDTQCSEVSEEHEAENNDNETEISSHL